MWLFSISEVSCTDTARRAFGGGGRPRKHTIKRPPWVSPPRPDTAGNPNWDPRITMKHRRALLRQERELARDTSKTPSSRPLVPSLNLSVSDVENMPLQPSPVLPEPEPEFTSSSAPIPKRDKSGAPKRYSVRRPYNWRDVKSNVRY